MVVSWVMYDDLASEFFWRLRIILIVISRESGGDKVLQTRLNAYNT